MEAETDLRTELPYQGDKLWRGQLNGKVDISVQSMSVELSVYTNSIISNIVIMISKIRLKL